MILKKIKNPKFNSLRKVTGILQTLQIHKMEEQFKITILVCNRVFLSTVGALEHP